MTVITWNTSGTDFYALPESISRLRVPLKDSYRGAKWYDFFGNLSRLRSIRSSIRYSRPDVAISVLDGSNELFLLSSMGMRFIRLVSSQNNLVGRGHYNRRWEILRKYIYRTADAVVLLDEKSAAETQKRYPKWKCVSIPNPLASIDTKPDHQAACIIQKMERFPLRITAMGRLVHQKGFDILLKAFKSVMSQVKNVGLVVLGEGPLRDDLEALRRELGLEEQVMLPGVAKCPHAVISCSDLFVFSSRFEGQGMALAEAMACGVPVVSFDCPYGPGSMVESTSGGILVPPGDQDALSAAMVLILSNSRLRRHYGSDAKRIADQLRPGRISERWEELIQACQ